MADKGSWNPRVLPITAPIKLQDTEYAQTIATVIQNIEEHQANDLFCTKTINALKEKPNEGTDQSFIVEGAKLFKIFDNKQLLVLPQHAQADVILAVHELFLHPGVNKTLMIVQRHFWGRSLDATTRDIISNCYRCKTSKISNQKVAPKPMHITASGPGELVCIDIYGPLPKCPGGNMALFVALDVLSGYVIVAPLKNMEADAFVNAARKIIRTFKTKNVCVQKFLSDNARQFRSKKFLNFCTDEGIKKIFTTPYNPPGNPVERVMRDLGEKFRILYNDTQGENIDHRNWDGYLSKIIFALNNTPKSSGYTPSEILGLEPFAPFRKYKIMPRIRSPLDKIKKELTSITMNTKSFAPTISIKKNKLEQYTYDRDGYVNVWTDAATKGKIDGEKTSAVGYWFAPGHLGNRAYVLDPPIKNNNAETMAVIIAVLHLVKNKIVKIRVKTDSQYIADLYNGDYLSQTNQNLIKYENYELLSFFVDLRAKLENYGIHDFSLKIEHVPGHSLDFGNLEVDWLVGWTVEKYSLYKTLLDPTIAELDVLQRYIYQTKKMEHVKSDHGAALRSSKNTVYNEGDVVAIKSHPLSSAGYGLKAKFMPRYNGEYTVVGQLSPNTYFVKDVTDPNAPTLTTNVRQMTLLRAYQPGSSDDQS